MKVHTIIIEFAIQYGIKEALILSELCRRAYASGEMIIPFPVSQGKSWFPYMSIKQIRSSLANLKAKGVINPIPPLQQTTDRSCHYEIHETAYRQFQEIIITQRFLLLEGFNLSFKEQ